MFPFAGCESSRRNGNSRTIRRIPCLETGIRVFVYLLVHFQVFGIAVAS